MKFNWIAPSNSNVNFDQHKLRLEYQLRPKLVQFLLKELEEECCVDFSCFVFDVYLATGKVAIAQETPEVFTAKISKGFKTYF